MSYDGQQQINKTNAHWTLENRQLDRLTSCLREHFSK